MYKDHKVAVLPGTTENVISQLQLIKHLGVEDRLTITKWEEQAVKHARQYVALIPEADLSNELVSSIKLNSVGSLQGSAVTGYVMIYLDANQLGESTTQPWCRQVNVSPGVVKKLVMAALAARGASESISDWDLLCMRDGGRHVEHTLLSAICNTDGKMLPKHKRSMFVIYSEQAVAARMGCPPRGTATMNQLETVFVVTKNILSVGKKPRLHFPGCTTSGNSLAPVGLPCRTEGWQLSFGEKKAAYGPNKRVLPGGPAEDPQAASGKNQRKDSDTEPFSYWGTVPPLYDELLNMGVIAVIDLTAGNGTFAEVCAKAQVPYLGITYTAKHAELLMDRLYSLVFASYTEEGSPLYDATLATIMKGTSGKPKPTKSKANVTTLKAEKAVKDSGKVSANAGASSSSTARNPELTRAALKRKLASLTKAAKAVGDEEDDEQDESESKDSGLDE